MSPTLEPTAVPAAEPFGEVVVDRVALLVAAKEKVAALLTALNIDTVIAVDDFYYPGEGSEGATELTEAMAASPALQSSVVEMLQLGARDSGFGDVDEANPSAVNDFLVDQWKGLPAELQRALVSSLRIQQQDNADKSSDDQIRDDLSAQITLKALFSDLVEFLPMSMTDWVATWRQVVTANKRYLVLIDRTLTREEHGAPDSGETLLEELLSDGPEGVYAGLFTHTASDEAAEAAMMQGLRTRFDAHKHRVVVLGKFRARSVEFFPAGLRVLLLVRELAAYRELATVTLTSAAAAAKDEFDQLNDYMLAEAMAAANEEGILELEHPLRIAQRAYSQTIARDVRTEAFDAEMLDSLRAGTVEAYQNASRDENQVRGMLRKDRFEPDGAVESLGMPIEVGDVFRMESLTGGGTLPRHYVLLGQACDLTLRIKGQREPRLSSLVLHEFTPRGEPPKDWRTQYEIGVFDLAEGLPWRVKFRHGVTVPIDSVDATVFHSDGASVVEGSHVEGRRMARGWLLREEELKETAGAQLDIYAQAEAELAGAAGREKWLQHLAASLTGASTNPKAGVTVKFDVGNRTISYGLQRVGRVRGETAARIADLASAYQARPAFEADIAGR